MYAMLMIARKEGQLERQQFSRESGVIHVRRAKYWAHRDIGRKRSRRRVQ
jgi:hypothetical protein